MFSANLLDRQKSPSFASATSLSSCAICQTLLHSFLNQCPSLVCKLAGVSYSKSSFWIDRTLRRLGTRLLDPTTWVIGKPACNSSLLLFTIGSGSVFSMTYSRGLSACLSVYHCTLIAYSLRAILTCPAIISRPVSFFQMHWFDHCVLLTALPSQTIWESPSPPLKSIQSPWLSWVVISFFSCTLSALVDVTPVPKVFLQLCLTNW